MPGRWGGGGAADGGRGGGRAPRSCSRRSLRRAKRVMVYRGTSLIRKRLSLGPYSRPMPRALWWSEEGGLLLMSEVPLLVFPVLARPALRKGYMVAMLVSVRKKRRLFYSTGGPLPRGEAAPEKENLRV